MIHKSQRAHSRRASKAHPSLYIGRSRPRGGGGAAASREGAVEAGPRHAAAGAEASNFSTQFSTARAATTHTSLHACRAAQSNATATATMCRHQPQPRETRERAAHMSMSATRCGRFFFFSSDLEDDLDLDDLDLERRSLSGSAGGGSACSSSLTVICSE